MNPTTIICLVVLAVVLVYKAWIIFLAWQGKLFSTPKAKTTTPMVGIISPDRTHARPYYRALARAALRREKKDEVHA